MASSGLFYKGDRLEHHYLLSLFLYSFFFFLSKNVHLKEVKQKSLFQK